MALFGLISDIHFDHYPDAGKRFLEFTKADDMDAMIVAGDVNECGNVLDDLRRICDNFPRVVFVPGNHDYYYVKSPEKLQADLRDLAAKLSNLTVLIRECVTIRDVKIAGATLWFRNTPVVSAHKNGFSDVRRIRNGARWCIEENEKDEAFFRSTKADIFVSHHMPSQVCVAPEFVGNPWNDFFCCPLADELESERMPKVWCYGHTHTQGDVQLRETRLVGNPYGYPSENKKNFKPDLRIHL